MVSYCTVAVYKVIASKQSPYVLPEEDHWHLASYRYAHRGEHGHGRAHRKHKKRKKRNRDADGETQGEKAAEAKVK